MHVYAASIKLEVFDGVGNAINSVGISQPFLVKVILEGFRKRVDKLVVPHMESIGGVCVRQGFYSGTGMNPHMDFSYSARIDVPGSYTIGPVSIEEDGKHITSNSLTIMVQENAQEDATTTTTSSSSIFAGKEKIAAPLYVDFFVDNDRVVVGQRIMSTVRFYYSCNSGVTGQMGLRIPALPGFKMGKDEWVEKKTEKVNGSQYNFTEWRRYIYPEEAGKKMIPAHSVDYAVQSMPLRGIFSFMFEEIKRAYSNVVHVTIDPLPPCTISSIDTSNNACVGAVGEFSKVVLSLDQQTMKEGTACVLTVVIEGEGNSECLEQFRLTDMPSSIKFYESKQYEVAGLPPHGPPKKCFEFVIQAISSGEYSIPSQKFVYFDTRDKQYRVLESNAVSCIVTAVPHVDHNGDSNNQIIQQGITQDITEQAKEYPSLLALNMTGPWYPVREPERLPCWLLLLLCVTPVCFITRNATSVQWIALYRRYERMYRSRRAFTRARREILATRASRNVAAFYGIIVRLIADRCMVPDTLISRAWINDVLDKKGCHSTEREEWNRFLDGLSALAFTNIGDHDNTIEEMLGHIEHWVSWLEDML